MTWTPLWLLPVCASFLVAACGKKAPEAPPATAVPPAPHAVEDVAAAVPDVAAAADTAPAAAADTAPAAAADTAPAAAADTAPPADVAAGPPDVAVVAAADAAAAADGAAPAEEAAAAPLGKHAVVPIEELADGLLSDEQSWAAWSPLANRVVYQERYAAEGTGVGLSIAFAKPGDTGEPDRIEVYSPEQEADKAKPKARKKILKKLKDQGYVRLTGNTWPTVTKDDRDVPLPAMVIAGLGKLSYAKKVLTLVGEDGKTTVIGDYSKAAPPHDPKPEMVFWSPGLKVLAVQIQWDPGDKYMEGFNVFWNDSVVMLPE